MNNINELLAERAKLIAKKKEIDKQIDTIKKETEPVICGNIRFIKDMNGETVRYRLSIKKIYGREKQQVWWGVQEGSFEDVWGCINEMINNLQNLRKEIGGTI